MASTSCDSTPTIGKFTDSLDSSNKEIVPSRSPTLPERAVAITPWPNAPYGVLDVERGDLITGIVDESEGGWASGDLRGVRGRFPRCIVLDNKQIMMLAEQGDSWAQLELSRRHRHRGTGLPADVAQYFHWCSRSAENNNPIALYNKGWSYETGTGVAQDWKQARVYYRRAAKLGLAAAERAIGTLYRIGWDGRQDIRRMVKWYTRGAAAGDRIAQLWLGRCYFEPVGVEQDIQIAVQLWTQAAERGNTDAQCELGDLYLSGRGIDMDVESGVKWISKAAEKLHWVALATLADCYLLGNGVGKDPVQAFALLVRSKEQAAIDGDEWQPETLRAFSRDEEFTREWHRLVSSSCIKIS